jgi:4-amino-4-deoxy-L-arabinose transferase-like glycosyltransferase
MTATLTPPVATEPARPAPPPRRRSPQRLWRGPSADPRWARPALLGLLAATAALYLVNLTASGWANAFYSAAAQAGSVSWKAFFFGSSDAANAITVDKSPASLWLMALSVRAFGLSSFSILLPEALMGVASVGVLYAAVKRVAGAGTGLLAGAALALTPVAALMFRFNNPDALMVLALVAAAWALTRAIEDGRTRWLLWCGALVGVAFLSKMMQAFLVLPGFGLAYLVAAPVAFRKRLWQLACGVGAMVVAGGWWFVAVTLIPAADRPFIGGSQTNSVWDLLFGYNGFGRLTGDEVGSVGWRDSSAWNKLFTSEMGGQIAWLLPAALIGLVALLVLRGRRPRTDALRAAAIVWRGWLVVTGVTFSMMQGIIHPYYTVALAPAVAALVALGARELWRNRESPLAIGTLAGSVVLTAVWSKILLARTSGYLPWLQTAVLIAGVLGGIGLVAAGLVAGRQRWLPAVAGTVALAAVLAGPAAYTVSTVATGHTGALPSAGPASSGFGGGGFGGGTGGGTGGAPGGGGFGGGTAGTTGTGGTTGGRGGGGGGGMGGLLGSTTPSAELTAALEADGSSYTWVAATVGSNNAAGYQLATGLPVMAVGGFNGTDPAPTLAQFQEYVKAGKIHWFIGGDSLGTGSSGSDDAAEIAQWVAANFTATTIGGTTVYDLTAAA